MNHYQQWQRQEQNFQRKCPIHNVIVSYSPNQKPTNYSTTQINSSNCIKQPQIYPQQRQIVQTRKEIINNEYRNYNIRNLNQNQNLSYNNYNYSGNSYQNNQQNNYSNKYYNNNYRNYNNQSNRYVNKNINTNNTNKKFTNYESSDGVIRGYYNNYSFYVSGSSQIKPKTANNNSPIQNNLNNNLNQYIKQNSNSSQGKTSQNQNFQNNINSYSNRQIINQNNNPSYIIKISEKVPNIYNPSNQLIENRNAINNNFNKNIYYNNENIYTEQKNYKQPIVQRRMVKRVVDKEPKDSRRDRFDLGPKDNLRNNQNKYRSNNIQQQPKLIFQKINDYNNNIGFRRFYSKNINEKQDNINNRYDYFDTYQPIKRSNTPNLQYSNINNSNYYRQIISTNQNRNIDPNYSENKINNISYDYNRQYPYKTFTERNGYIISTTRVNNNRNIYQNINLPKQRDYTSKTELKTQRDFKYEYENDDDDEVYEVPEQYDKNYNNIKHIKYLDERIQNNFDERTFNRISNYSPSYRIRKGYNVYTPSMAMNRNYSNFNEYEYDINKNRYRENYSQPKIMKPINDVKRLLKKKREYSAFERNLKNIRNEEEFELGNEERNNRVRLNSSEYNNQSFYISSNSNCHPLSHYKTFTEHQDYRKQRKRLYLEDIDNSNIEDYDGFYQCQDNKNINNFNNIRLIQSERNKIIDDRRIQEQYHQGENQYYNENIIKNNNQEEIEEDDHKKEEEKMYKSRQLFNSKEENLGITNNNIRQKENYEINNEDIPYPEEYDQMYEKQGVIIGNEEEIIPQNNNNEEGIYQMEEIPKDRNEEVPMSGKKVKNIETEINEKYYDNKGNYLGEKNTVTTQQVPIYDEGEFINQKDGQVFYKGQEYQEEDENIDEYMPYQSSHKEFKKRGEKANRESGAKIENYNLKINDNYEDLKYDIHLENSNNNIYNEKNEEIKKEFNNSEEIENKKYKEPMNLVKNENFEIPSENLYVTSEDNGNKPQNELRISNYNDEKEADEQQIEVQSEMEENDLQKSTNENNINKDSNLQIENINENTNENINSEKKEELENMEQNDYNNNEDNNINNIENENNYEKNDYNKGENISDNNDKFNNEENNINNNKEKIYTNNDERNSDNENNINDNYEKIYTNNKKTNSDNENNINNNKNIEMKENNDDRNEYNIGYENENYNEEEQIIDENERQELENQYIQKDEGEEENFENGIPENERDINYNNYQKEFE